MYVERIERAWRLAHKQGEGHKGKYSSRFLSLEDWLAFLPAFQLRRMGKSEMTIVNILPVSRKENDSHL